MPNEKMAGFSEDFLDPDGHIPRYDSTWVTRFWGRAMRFPGHSRAKNTEGPETLLKIALLGVDSPYNPRPNGVE